MRRAGVILSAVTVELQEWRTLSAEDHKEIDRGRHDSI